MSRRSQVAVRALIRRLSVVTLLLAVLPLPGSAEDWDETRKRLIEPLNSMLHSHWPSELAAGNIDVMLRFYATDEGTGLTWLHPEAIATGATETTYRFGGPVGTESIRDRYTKLLDQFSEIDRADLRIERVDWRNPTPLGHRATVHALFRGKGPDGDLRQLEQWATLYVRFFDPFWEITSEEVTGRTLVSSAAPRFTWRTDDAGIDDLHANVESPPFRLFGNTEENPVREASGVAVGDADGDGCEDLVLAGSPRLSFYRGGCDGTFAEATAASGLPSPYPAAAGGVLFFDYDNDGWRDLYVAAVSGGDRLFQNQGKGRFVDVTEAAGITPGVWGSMPVAADYDRDGLLDLYVARMGNHESNTPKPPYAAKNGVRGTLWHNNGDGTFEDVSKAAGVDSPGWDMAAAWGDYDGDGWPDLYVANEFGSNRLLHNEQDGTFSDRTKQSGTADGGSAMGTAWGDIDGDGDLDLFVSGMHSNSGWTMFHPDFPIPIPWPFRFLGLFTDAVQNESDIITDRLSRGSSLLRNNGDGTFTDISDDAGVRDGQWGWAGDFFDYDNDGDLDLFAVNGFISGPREDDL